MTESETTPFRTATFVLIGVVVLLVGYLIKMRMQLQDALREAVNHHIWKVNFCDLNLVKKLGEGACGTVYSAKWHGKDVAAKVFDKQAGSVPLTAFAMEVAIMQDLRHPNVVLFMGACFEPENLCILTELLRCSLYDFLQAVKNKKKLKGRCQSISENLYKIDGSLPWLDRIQIIIDACHGMNYLHSLGILHHDFKSPNLLLGDFNNCKVADFGMISIQPGMHKAILKKMSSSIRQQTQRSIVPTGRFKSIMKVSILPIRLEGSDGYPVDPLDDRTQSAGTPQWTAPEVIEGKQFTQAADVYSMGIVIAEVAKIDDAYPGMSPFQTTLGVAQGTLRPTLPNDCPPKMASLLNMCWHQDPSQRPTFSLLLDQLYAIQVAWTRTPPDKLTSKLTSSKSSGAQNEPGHVQEPWWINSVNVCMGETIKKGDCYTLMKGVYTMNPPVTVASTRKPRRRMSLAGALSVIDVGSMVFHHSGKQKPQTDSRTVAPARTSDAAIRIFDVGAATHVINKFAESMGNRFTLKHPNIEIVFGGWIDDAKLVIVSELSQNGSLRDMLDLKFKKNTMNDGSFINQFISGLRGLQFLHCTKVVSHNNIKATNFLSFSNGNDEVIKLTGFGFESILKRLSSKDQTIGSPAWSSPEVLMSEEYSIQGDIYAIGITLWEMLTGMTPFADIETHLLAKHVCIAQKRPAIPAYDTELFPYDQNVFDEYCRIMISCWDGDVKKRPTIIQLVSTISNICV